MKHQAPNYFDNMDEAKKDPEKVHYLDLSLQSPKLTTIPPEIYTFTNLKKLTLSFNRIVSVDDGIGNLVNLEELHIEGNHYMTSFSLEVAKCTKLVKVNIKDARIPAEKVTSLAEALPKGCELIK